jgi:hypothetical protein
MPTIIHKSDCANTRLSVYFHIPEKDSNIKKTPSIKSIEIMPKYKTKSTILEDMIKSF